MTTPRDLMIIALEVAPSRPVERGALSLALAGAELIDLLAAGAATLDGEQIVPGDRWDLSDGLLDEAGSALSREAPHESVDDWLWRRGRDLAPAYASALEADGRLTRRRSRWTPFRTGPLEPADTADRRSALERWRSDEPVLSALATAVGIREEEAAGSPGTADDAVETVLAAVGDASVELEAVRQRRTIEQAAFDNVWRGE